ncbi:MAG TPA: phosphotransferase [Acidimicrobiales bacterium]|nr:phosphotransferase [Acidimicrobiales bacterium]
MLRPVDQVVAEGLRAGLETTELSVFGTADPERITEIVETFCRVHLGDTPHGAHFYASSVGCVIGLALETGRDVVMKSYQPRWRRPFLEAVQDAQRYAASGGLPCAMPLLAPAPVVEDGDRFAVVESWLPDPGMRPLASDAALSVSAAGLARQISSCRALDKADALLDHPLRSSPAGLYGEPHSPHFDFEGSSSGAEWIDDVARRAAAIRDREVTRRVVSHTDWSARNVRYDERRVLAVYDWDSVALVEESTAVGQAAVTWRVTAEPGGTEFPTADEVLRYVDSYEDAVGRAFSAGQRHAATAAAAYLLAYTSRCEHALEYAGIARSDPGAARAARDRLAEDGDQLLAGT